MLPYSSNSIVIFIFENIENELPLAQTHTYIFISNRSCFFFASNFFCLPFDGNTIPCMSLKNQKFMLSSWANVIDKIMRLMTTIYRCRTYLKSHIFGFVRMQNHFAYGTRERERVSSSLTSLLSVHQNSAYMQTPKILIPMTKSNFIPIQFNPLHTFCFNFFLFSFPVSFSTVVFRDWCRAQEKNVTCFLLHHCNILWSVCTWVDGCIFVNTLELNVMRWNK